MHPYSKLPAGDCSLEALLQEQGAFAERPSVRLKRTKQKEEPKEKAPAKPSLFKQLRQGIGSSTPAATASHPELQALEGDAIRDDPLCMKEVSERPAHFLEEVGAFAAPASGFPVPPHRAVGKFLGASAKTSLVPQNEEDEIDLENRETLMNASPEEVKEWQQQLLQQLGAETCERLRRRGQRKAQVNAKLKPAKAAKEVPSVALQMGEQEMVLDRSELQKLQWTAPAGEPDFDKVLADPSLPPEPCGQAIQLIRFDFEGRVCPRGEEQEEEPSQGLHHHGAESSQAGYTLAELLLLSRSTSAPQRSAALNVLGAVLKRARIPAPQDVLKEDAAVKRIGSLASANGMWRAGFGLGLQVFFWHFLARSDVPKHLAEALQDPAQPVQLAALRATAELLDGVAEGELRGDVLRGGNREGPRSSSVEAAVLRPWDAARTLVWPSAPLTRAEALTRQSVAVLSAEGFGGQGGGRSAWPPLLKQQLLGAKEEPEVTAAQVLEPLWTALDLTPQEPGLLARALGAAVALQPELGTRLLKPAHRSLWIAAADDLEVLRFIRMSCEALGRGAVAWWLREEAEKLLSSLRRSVLSPLLGGSTVLEALRAVEALRCWLSFLRCGAGHDHLRSFAAEIGSWWHRFSVQQLEGELGESHFLLTAHLLELTYEVFRLRQSDFEEPVEPLLPCDEGAAAALSSAFSGASSILAQRLSGTGPSMAQQLCLASFADVLEVALSAAIASDRLEGVDSPLRPARQLLGAQKDDAVPLFAADCGDEAAPWPLGGFFSGSLACLARLRALGALCRLGGKVDGCRDWLLRVRSRALQALQQAPPKETEALVGRVWQDPLSALVVDVSIACDEPLREFGQAIALCGSWPTAHALFCHAGLNFGDAEEAVVRAAFQPHAVWSEVEASGPPSMAFAAAPFWALAMGETALLQPLATVQALELSYAAPSWLPFVAFASALSLKIQGEYLWRTAQEELNAYVERHLRRTPTWSAAGQEWFTELLRGLCDRLAKIFLEESFMDPLLASVVWSFSACFMPAACQAVCWGGDDSTLLHFLDRALPLEMPLLWRDEDYVAPEGAASKLRGSSRTWPRAIAERSRVQALQAVHAREEHLQIDLHSLE